MKLIQGAYKRIAGIAGHHRAAYAVATLGLLDGSISPLPPDVLLIPMILAKPQRAKYYAFLTILCSALGAFVGYSIGHFAFDFLGQPIIQYFDYEATYSELMGWFAQWGVFVIVLASVLPIPFKLWCIAAGALHMFLPAFFIAVLIARTIRFSLVAFVVQKNQRLISGFFHWARYHTRSLLLIILAAMIPILIYCLR